MTTITFGAGGDEAGLVEALLAAGAYSGEVVLDQVGASSVSTANHQININNPTSIRITSSFNEANADRPDLWHRITRASSSGVARLLLMHQFIGPDYRMDHVHWYGNSGTHGPTQLIGIQEFIYAQVLDFFIDHCIFSALGGIWDGNVGLDLLSTAYVSYKVEDCKFWGIGGGLKLPSTTASVLANNCSFGKCEDWGIGFYTTGANCTLKNCVSVWDSGARGVGEDWALTGVSAVTIQHCASQDNTLSGIGSDNEIGIVPDNEFKSLDTTDFLDYLQLKDGYHLNPDPLVLPNGGTQIAGITDDFLGHSIPDAFDNYPIGAHTSYVADFPTVIIDSGVIYKNYGEVDEEIIGATRGGNVFGIEQRIIDIGYDGGMSNVKGARRILSVRPYILANFVEINPALIGLSLPASVINTDAGMAIITRALQLALADYITNITLIGEVRGKTEPIICVVENALVDSDFSIEMKKANEAVLQVKFIGHFDPADLNSEPWAIRYPKL